jgi:hypothetical protein
MKRTWIQALFKLMDHLNVGLGVHVCFNLRYDEYLEIR